MRIDLQINKTMEKTLYKLACVQNEHVSAPIFGILYDALQVYRFKLYLEHIFPYIPLKGIGVI